jgi:biotin carboxyl carrier protein
MRIYDLNINNKAYTIKVKSFSREAAELEVNGQSITVAVNKIVDDSAVIKPSSRATSTQTPKKQAKAAPAAGSGAGAVVAPIPGAIMEIFVKEGDTVTAGQPVLKMEAMKMENVINSPLAGTVGRICVHAGDAVAQGQELLIIG